MPGMSVKTDNRIMPDSTVSMSDREFRLFSELIYNELGIKMPPAKKTMLTSRLGKRLRALGLRSYDQYFKLVMGDSARTGEFNRMADAVTTNKTDFFRESVHFDIMRSEALPQMVLGERFRLQKKLYTWSAGCSTGEEAYTMAIVLSEFLGGISGSDFEILATDVSEKVLAAGKNAVYREGVVKPVPLALRRKYLMKGKGDKKGLFRVVPELRKKVLFRYLNFMDRDFDIQTKPDIIFCRNVIIYFDRETQKELFKKFYRVLVPGGYLFIGSSETLNGVNDMFYSVGPSVYRKPE